MSTVPNWVVRQGARVDVIAALFVRQHLGIRGPHDIPPLRGVPVAVDPPAESTRKALESQFEQYWFLTVEPQSSTSTGALDFVPGFRGHAVLPVDGFDLLRSAMTGLGSAAVTYAQAAYARYLGESFSGVAEGRRAYASAVADFERRSGRRAHPFELRVEVLPLAQRGVWRIAPLTIAVTDGLRSDVAAFDAAIAPVIADLA